MSNNANKGNSSPMKVITGPDTRWSYANIWEAKSINGGAPKFSVSLIIPKSDTRTVAKSKLQSRLLIMKANRSIKATVKVYHPFLPLRHPYATVTPNARTTLPTPILTLLMPTQLLLQASWVQTAIRSSIVRRSTAEFTDALALISMPSTATETKAWPAD